MKAMIKKGFTMVELVVVMVILALIAAIAIPSAMHYIKLAEFRKNESNAKTVYLAAESVLTYYRNSGQWETFEKQVRQQGVLTPPDLYGDLAEPGSVYAVTLDSNSYQSAADSHPVLQLLDRSTYDKDLLNGAIAIEIDIRTGHVFSAFYGTRCKGLSYGEQEGCSDMCVRDYESRRDVLLGYYSVEDTTNVVELTPTRLKITALNLVNSETLYLSWSSNSPLDNLDVNFRLRFFQDGPGGGELFEMNIDRYELQAEGWSQNGNSMASLPVKAAGTVETDWRFPLTYHSSGQFTLVLDGMMSAKLQEALAAADLKNDETAALPLHKSSDVSITRLSAIAQALKDPQDIYVSVQALPAYHNAGENTVEYRPSEAVNSNTANTLFANGSKEGKMEVALFRHLSNIRYYEKEDTKKTATQFTLTSRNMDWNSVGTGVYDLAAADGAASPLLTPVWRANSQEEPQDFPTIPLLEEAYTLSGKGGDAFVSNLRLGKASVIDDATAEKLYGDEKKAPAYLGLFGEIAGTVEKLTFQEPVLTLGMDANGKPAEESSHSALLGVGVLAGRSQGSLTDIQVLAKKAGSGVRAALAKERDVAKAKKPAAIGGLVGVLGMAGADGTVTPLSGTVSLSGLLMEGEVVGRLPVPSIDSNQYEESLEGDQRAYAGDYPYGVGGIVGYACLGTKDGEGEKAAVLKGCTNRAAVSGNLFTGGIAGRLDGAFAYVDGGNMAEADATLIDGVNDGLILCTDKGEEQAKESGLAGRYIGGIVGYGDKALVYRARSASGRASDFAYTGGESGLALLRGCYVGGIIGYGSDCLLNSCSTQKGGYILGSDYVGGIAGGLAGSISDAIRAEGGISVTTNAGYVIGNRYVGGIVGKNAGNASIRNCVNNGVAAGYDRYIGGIAGYNEGASIENCASYISDYDNSIYTKVVEEWKATGDFTGGLAGYNNGSISFQSKDSAISVQSVSGIVAGGNYVGGLVGFNDKEGVLDVHYSLIGGRVYASGDCAGGAVGFNASPEFLTKELQIRPSSVQGRYYVGGVIGANVVDLTENTRISGLRANNALGSITAQAYCGGLIGYQRTYSSRQLGGASSLLAYLENEGNTPLLPGLTEENIPGEALASDNVHTLTITQPENQDEFRTAANNVPIRSYLYTGGIVGYCEKGSLLVLSLCYNAGDISLPEAGAFEAGTAEQLRQGVDLAGYLTKETTNGDGQNIPEKLTVYLVGGILGANLENQIIDHCTNTGSMTGLTGLGGIVGFNGGGVFNCTLKGNFGSREMNYLGGIAGLNIKTSADGVEAYYCDTQEVEWTYTPGTIAACGTESGRTLSGGSNVGGIAGYNMAGGVLKDNLSQMDITAYGTENAGGIAGRNAGRIITAQDDGSLRWVSAANAQGVGGLVGINEFGGEIQISQEGFQNQDFIVAVGDGVTVSGRLSVGGIAGINQGDLGGDKDSLLTSQAKSVRAREGNAGGIAGVCQGNIRYAVNDSGEVSADEGLAGGITAKNEAGNSIKYCSNTGNVSSNQGHAGGIVGENDGRIVACTVGSAKGLTIRSQGVAESGAVTAVNLESGVVTGSRPLSGVTLSGSPVLFGGIAGLNQGTVEAAEMDALPKISSSGARLTVGGAVGWNTGRVKGIRVKVEFPEQSAYRCLGGVVGENGSAGNPQEAAVVNCAFTGSITQKSGSTAGSCYGGIAGLNYGSLDGCTVEKIKVKLTGVYTATSTSTAAEKEALSSHVGGIVGKNETEGRIVGCVLKNTDQSKFDVENGMVGGVAGYNKGELRLSGAENTPELMKDAGNVAQLHGKAQSLGYGADAGYVSWQERASIENLRYNNNGPSVTAGRMQMILSVNGNLGGVTAYNSPTGKVEYCASGSWFLNNKSNAIGVGTGGAIGMNESERDLRFLVNGAFVGRQLGNGTTDRFAGGIIGNQNNTTKNRWKIQDCINYGTVYCYKAHYSGGILGQWTGTGGTIERCRNYGNLQTTYQTGWKGASAGIVAQLYHASEGDEYNIISCGNYGDLLGRAGRDAGDCANDSAGILGNVTNYAAGDAASGQEYTIQVLDCVNGPGVEIYSNSMASGIVGFFSVDANPSAGTIKAATTNTWLRIERCRNFAERLYGKSFAGGIFGDRYGENQGKPRTVIHDCYSVNPVDNGYSHKDFPTVSLNTGNSIKNVTAKQNYFFDGTADTWNPKTFFYRGDLTVRANQNTGGGSGSLNPSLFSDSSNTGHAFILRDTSGNYFAAEIHKSIVGRSCYLQTLGNRTYLVQNEDRVGEKLFDLRAGYSTMASIIAENIDQSLIFDDYTRKSYARIEGIKDNSSQMTVPNSVNAEMSNGMISAEIIPGGDCDPFKYELGISTDGGNTVVATGEYIYTENGSFPIPEDLSISGSVKIYVRAVSMFDEVSPSEWVSANNETEVKMLPAPKVRAELVRKNGNYTYQFRLENLDEYQPYSGWRVVVRVLGGKSITLDANTSTGEMSGIGSGAQQMIAQAVGNAMNLWDSAQISTPICLPAYQPNMALKNEKSVAAPSAVISGDTLEDLTVTVALDSRTSGIISDPLPIYRAELVGDWKGEKDVVFAKGDILTVAGGAPTLTFSHLPDYLRQAEKLGVRIWYAQSGLGPVYTYWDLKTEQGANVRELIGCEGDQESWAYGCSTVLENTSGYFNNYLYRTEELFTWLPAPVLEEPVRDYDPDGSLQYTFAWDQGVSGTEAAAYRVALTGINEEEGRRVAISAEGFGGQPGEKAFTVSAEDWNYDQVELKVTRVGDSKTGQIGLSTTETYPVSQRLPRPGQPIPRKSIFQNLTNLR